MAAGPGPELFYAQKLAANHTCPPRLMLKGDSMHSIINYSGYHHVLGRESRFVHPGNGTLYACACEAQPWHGQDLSIYRLRPGATAWELVKRYTGTVDAVVSSQWAAR